MKVTLGVRTVDGTAGAAAWEIIAAATPGRVKVMELGFFLAAGTASIYGLGRPAAIGVTPTTPVDFLVEDPADVIAANVALSALAWATGPTAPAAFMRRIALPATIGTGVIWTFPKGIVLAVSSSLVLWNIGTNGVVDAYAVLDI